MLQTEWSKYWYWFSNIRKVLVLVLPIFLKVLLTTLSIWFELVINAAAGSATCCMVSLSFATYMQILGLMSGSHTCHVGVHILQ